MWCEITLLIQWSTQWKIMNRLRNNMITDWVASNCMCGSWLSNNCWTVLRKLSTNKFKDWVRQAIRIWSIASIASLTKLGDIKGAKLMNGKQICSWIMTVNKVYECQTAVWSISKHTPFDAWPSRELSFEPNTRQFDPAFPETRRHKKWAFPCCS